eukprot:scaffold16844_cov35-Prasinocladus_malaysianus.AAC.1
MYGLGTSTSKVVFCHLGGPPGRGGPEAGGKPDPSGFCAPSAQSARLLAQLHKDPNWTGTISPHTSTRRI